MRLNNLAHTGQSQAIISANKAEQLHALLDFLRMPAVRRALQEAPATVQSGICALANDCQAEAFAGRQQ